MMPLQLRNAKRPRHSNRPTIELMEHVDIHQLREFIPRRHGNIIKIGAGLKYPAGMVISARGVDFHRKCGTIQHVGLAWIRTGFGRPRAIFVCQCGYGARRLFLHHGRLACRFCHQARYASQQRDHLGRKRLQAAKLRLVNLGGLPSNDLPLPPKPKWTRRKTYQRVCSEIKALEAQAKTQHFTRPLSTKLFAYHLRLGRVLINCEPCPPSGKPDIEPTWPNDRV